MLKNNKIEMLLRNALLVSRTHRYYFLILDRSADPFIKNPGIMVGWLVLQHVNYCKFYIYCKFFLQLFKEANIDSL